MYKLITASTLKDGGFGKLSLLSFSSQDRTKDESFVAMSARWPRTETNCVYTQV